MAKLLVAGIRVELQYVFDDYFQTLIDPYVTSYDNPQHRIMVRVESGFDVPNGLRETAAYRNRHVYQDNNQTWIAAYDESGVCKQMICHDRDYRLITVRLHEQDERSRLAELEYVLTGMIFMELALLHGRVALHASAIRLGDDAVLFAATSGTGKSTHARHWIERFDATYINDDKPLLYLEDGRLWVAGSPWCGKDMKQANDHATVKAVVCIARGTNKIVQLSNKEKMVKLFQHVVRPRNRELLDVVSNMIESIIDKVLVVSFESRITADSAAVLHHEIFGGQYEDKV